MDIGYDKPLYILPFDHRASVEKGLFGFTAPLSAEQTATVAASKQVVYEGLLLPVDLADIFAAGQRHGDIEFVLDDLDGARDAGAAGRPERVHLEVEPAPGRARRHRGDREDQKPRLVPPRIDSKGAR